MRELVSIHLARTHDVDLESDDEAEPMAQGGSDGGGGGDGGDGDGGGGEPAKRQRGQKSKKKSHTARRIAKNAAKRATARIWDAQGMPDL